jgi:hypothetical protein
VAVLGLLDHRAADGIHSREDIYSNSAGGTDPDGAGGTGPGVSRIDTSNASGTEPNNTGRNDSASRSDPNSPRGIDHPEPAAAPFQKNAWAKALKKVQKRETASETERRAEFSRFWDNLLSVPPPSASSKT